MKVKPGNTRNRLALTVDQTFLMLDLDQERVNRERAHKTAQQRMKIVTLAKHRSGWCGSCPYK